jgi:hypothetical protein
LESKESKYYDCFNECFENITFFTKDEIDSGGGFLSDGSVLHELAKVKSVLEFENKYKSYFDSLYKKKVEFYQALENAVLHSNSSKFEYVILLMSNKVYDNVLLSKFSRIFNDNLRDLIAKLEVKPVIIENLGELDFLKKITTSINIKELTSFNEAVAFAYNQIN